MSIASEVERIKTNIANTYTALEEKGATMPEVQDSANLADTVATVTTGGGGGGAYNRSGWTVPENYITLDNMVANIRTLFPNEFAEATTYIKSKVGTSGLTGVFAFIPRMTYCKLKVNLGYYSTTFPILIIHNTVTGDNTIYKHTALGGTSNNLTLEVTNDTIVIALMRGSINLYSTSQSFLLHLNNNSESSEYSIGRGASYYAHTSDISIQNTTSISSIDSFNRFINDEYTGNATKVSFCPPGYDTNDNVWPNIKYYPPASYFNSDTTSVTSIKAYHLPVNLPEGMIFTGSSLTIGADPGSTDSQLARNSNLREAKITFPSGDVTMDKKVILNLESWEYIAEHALAVGGATLTIDKGNYYVCGGDTSGPLSILQSKGWNITYIG